MKIYAVYDHAGEILAAVHLDQPHPAGRHISPPMPRPQAGQKAAEIEVPAEFAHLTFQDVCGQLRVNTKSHVPALVRSEEQGRG